MHRVAPAPSLREPDLERALERLRETVRTKGLKKSSARELVARAALQRQGHFSAEDLAGDLRREQAGPHSGTVYRVLPLLLEAGLLQEALVARGESTKYERAFEREHHDHLVCTQCGKVVEFHSEAIEALQSELAEAFGFTLTSHRHELQGMCAGCRGK